MTSSTIQLSLVAALFVAGCGPSEDPSRPSVVLYVAHDSVHSDPIIRAFERQTGIDVKVVGDTEANKTTGLALRLLSEASDPRADVWWNNEIMRTAQLADRGLLASFTPQSAAGLPARHCDSAGRWVGFGARARIILYNTDLLDEKDAPTSIFELTEERFRGKVVIAKPLFGTTSTHVAALFASLGEEKAKRFFEDLKANDVLVTDGNALARNLVRDGRIAICLTDTDDANGALRQKKPVAMIYPDQGEGQIGTLIIPNTVSLVKGGPNPDAGKRLVEFLASREVEEMLARSAAAQMPLREGLEPHSPLFDLGTVKAMDIDWRRVAEMTEPSAEFVRKVFLR
jgi:iron(III) transport system substrate-binding protein